MTLLFMESFDGGDAATKWTSWGGVIGTSSPRWVGGSHNAFHGNNAFSANIVRKVLTAGAHATFIVGCAVSVSNLTSGSTDGVNGKGFFSLMGDGGTTRHLTINCTSLGAVTVRRGDGDGTLLGTSATGKILDSTWHYLELKATLHDSTGTVDVQVDGVNVLSLTGQDTKNGGTNATFDSLQLGTANSNSNFFTLHRDIYICNGAGSVNNDFLGDCKVSLFVPTADSTPEQWTTSTGTSSFALVDEATPNSDTDYIQSSVDGDITRLELADMTDTTHQVYGIQTAAFAKKDDAGTKSFRVGIFSDATLGNGADHVLTTSYTTYLDVMELDPDGSVVWTPAQFNAAFIQVEARP